MKFCGNIFSPENDADVLECDKIQIVSELDEYEYTSIQKASRTRQTLKKVCFSPACFGANPARDARVVRASAAGLCRASAPSLGASPYPHPGFLEAGGRILEKVRSRLYQRE